MSALTLGLALPSPGAPLAAPFATITPGEGS